MMHELKTLASPFQAVLDGSTGHVSCGDGPR